MNPYPSTPENPGIIQDALRLRELAIRKVTTTLGRGLLRISGTPSYISRGLYLPAPYLPRHLQANANDPSYNCGAFTISRGIDPVVGMTVIEYTPDIYVPPSVAITYDFLSRDHTEVRFYQDRKRLDPAHPEVNWVLGILDSAVSE
jgi:hypothetical protein